MALRNLQILIPLDSSDDKQLNRKTDTLYAAGQEPLYQDLLLIVFTMHYGVVN